MKRTCCLLAKFASKNPRGRQSMLTPNEAHQGTILSPHRKEKGDEEDYHPLRLAGGAEAGERSRVNEHLIQQPLGHSTDLQRQPLGGICPLTSDTSTLPFD